MQINNIPYSAYRLYSLLHFYFQQRNKKKSIKVSFGCAFTSRCWCFLIDSRTYIKWFSMTYSRNTERTKSREKRNKNNNFFFNKNRKRNQATHSEKIVSLFIKNISVWREMLSHSTFFSLLLHNIIAIIWDEKLKNHFALRFSI